MHLFKTDRVDKQTQNWPITLLTSKYKTVFSICKQISSFFLNLYFNLF